MHPRPDESPLRHDDAAELRDDVLAPLREQLRRLRERVLEAEEEHRGHLDAVPEAWRESARNLVHYLGLRRHDTRPLQIELGFAGLSSLGRLEAHVLAGIDSVLYALDRIVGVRGRPERDRPEAKNFRDGDNALIQHTEELLGPAVTDRVVRVMVTLPSVAASDYGLVRDLMRAGMSVARINSAHDDTASWEAMIQHVRRAESETGQRCRVLFDLCGPKLRTGDVQPRPGIEKLRPARDERGFVVAPATVWIGSGPPPPDREMPAVVPVDDDFASRSKAATRSSSRICPADLAGSS